MASQVERWIDGHTAAGEEAEERRMSDIVIKPPDLQAIRADYHSIVQQAEFLEIATKQQHEGGLLLLKDIRGRKKGVKGQIDPICSQANTLHKSLTGLRKNALSPLDRAEAITLGKLSIYEQDQIAIAEKASEDSPVEIEPEIATVAGISTRTTYKVMVRDKVLLAEYVADNPKEAHLIEPNMPALSRLARAQQHAFRIPGCELLVEKSKTVRTA